MSSKPKKKLGMGCLILFALPFAAVGAVMSVLTVRSLLYWNQVQSWTETPCTILEASLEENSDSDGGRAYQAVARYKYHWAGKDYESDVVGVHGGSDNLGSFQRNKARELERHLQNGKPFRCFVNTSNPSEALLYRDLRLGMLAFKAMFGFIFGGVGFGLIGVAIWGGKKIKRKELRKQLHPGEPWLCRDDWANKRIRSSRWGPALMMAGFAFFWNALSWAAAAAFFFGDKEMPAWAKAICLGFPAIGLLLLGTAIYLVIGAWRWGVSELEMAAVPGVLGGRVAGVIYAPAGLEVADRFLLTLTCFEKKTRSTSDGTETYDEPIWQADQEIIQTLGGGHANKTIVPVSFYVPYDQHPTDSEAGFSWKLEAKAEVPGIDYHAEFEVPIFKTDDSSPDPPEKNALLTEFAAPQSFESALARAGGRLLSETSSRCEVLFPMGRNLGLALGITVFTIVWVCVSVGLLYSDAPIVFRIVFPLSSLAILAITVWLWLEKTSLNFGTDGVEVQGGLLGMGKRRRFEQRDIRSLVVETSGTRSGSTVYQQVTLKTRDGETKKLVSGIARRSDAQTIATKIEEMLGIAKSQEEKPFSLEMDLPEGEAFS